MTWWRAADISEERIFTMMKKNPNLRTQHLETVESVAWVPRYNFSNVTPFMVDNACKSTALQVFRADWYSDIHETMLFEDITSTVHVYR